MTTSRLRAISSQTPEATPQGRGHSPLMTLVLERRCKGMFNLALVGMTLTALNVMISATGGVHPRFFNDVGVGVGIFTGYALSAILARGKRLSASLSAATLGMILPIVIGDLIHGDYTERLLYLLLAVSIPSFGLDRRFLLGFYLVTFFSVLSLIFLMPGDMRLGPDGFRTLLLDLVLILTGAVALFWVNLKQTNEAIEELWDERQRATQARAQAEQEARRAEVANNSKSMFLANVSHELRTPLNAIMGYVELVREEAELEALELWYDEELGHVHQASGQLLQLINDVLDLSKIEAGRLSIVAGSFELDELLEELVELVEPLAEARGNVLILEQQECPGYTLCSDRLRLKQVLLNLLSNAVKFTSEGEIRIGVEDVSAEHEDEGGAWIRIEVCDQGIGMSREQMERIFEPFLQASESTAHQYGGTGLGLALSRRICTLLQGSIWVESGGQGEGASFFVEIPCQWSETRSTRRGRR